MIAYSAMAVMTSSVVRVGPTCCVATAATMSEKGATGNDELHGGAGFDVLRAGSGADLCMSGEDVAGC